MRKSPGKRFQQGCGWKKLMLKCDSETYKTASTESHDMEATKDMLNFPPRVLIFILIRSCASSSGGHITVISSAAVVKIIIILLRFISLHQCPPSRSLPGPHRYPGFSSASAFIFHPQNVSRFAVSSRRERRNNNYSQEQLLECSFVLRPLR